MPKIAEKITEGMKEEESLKNWRIADCRLREQPLAIWNQSTWDSVKDAYRRAVGMEHSSVAGTDSVSSMNAVPYEVRWVEEYKTRSVFVTERVEKGQLVWKPTQRVKFVEEAPFRRFLSSISYDMACDILSFWAYVVEEEDDDEYVFACVVELGDSVYMGIDDESFFTYNATGVFASDTVEAGTEIELQDEGDSVVKDDYIDWFSYWKEEANSISIHQNDIDILAKLNMTNCNLHERSFPTWDNETWKRLQDLYRHVVGVENSTIPLDSESGMLIPYEVHRWQKGSSSQNVYLTQPVEKGQAIWSPSHIAKFVTEASFKQFLSSMSDDMSCFILLTLSYVMKDDEHDFAYFVDLDVSNYMSVGNDEAPFFANSTGIFAVRDVDAGESITVDASDFNDDVVNHRNIKWLSGLKRAALSPIVTGCGRGASEHSILDEDTWENLRNEYRRAVGASLSSISADNKKSGVLVPYEVRKDPIKGRGLFLTENVKKGQIVWDKSQHAKFAKEIYFHRFLSSIPHDLACDVLQWAYIVEDPEYGPVCAFELDDGTYMNNGGVDASFDFSEDGVVALRDVDAGEEIVVNYDVLKEGIGFVEDYENPWFFEAKRMAWGYINDHVGIEYDDVVQPDEIEAESTGLEYKFTNESILRLAICFLSLLLLFRLVRLRRHTVTTSQSAKEKYI
eukprot:scaffold275695_cov50-Attheya_sp.AAC.1